MPAPYVRGAALRPGLSVRFTPSDEARVRARAAREGRTPTDLIRDATLAYIDAGDRADTQTEETGNA